MGERVTAEQPSPARPAPTPPTHIFLGEVDEVLQVNVVTVGPDVVVDEEVELVLDPVLEDEGQHARRQLQEEDDAQEDRELQWTGGVSAFCRAIGLSRSLRRRTNLSRKVFSRSAPMQPAKPRMNITPPTTMKSQTGSRPPRSVMDEMLDRTPWGQGGRSLAVSVA